MLTNRTIGTVLFMAVCLLFTCYPALCRERETAYKTGARPPKKYERRYGPLGMKGMLNKNKPRDVIYVEEVRPDGPGRELRRTDVILGVVSPVLKGVTNVGEFKSDPNREIAAAIEEVERKDTGDKLVLRVWRPRSKITKGKAKGSKKPVDMRVIDSAKDAKVINVTITLPQIGGFSSTSPWNCKKTEYLVSLIEDRIAKGGYKFDKGIPSILEALGLLATGNKKHLPYIQKYARSFGGANYTLANHPKGLKTWNASYSGVFLSEYYLATGDKEVLPSIRGYARFLGQGVSGVGTWGHGTTNPARDGGLYGPTGGYGAMNQAGAVAALSLVLAQKCGIKDVYVDRAAKLALDYFEYYVDKGCIPYGDGPPKAAKYESNGRMSITAVLFDIAGRKRGADYFTRMTLASHRKREGGHTGHFLAWQWAAAGAARGGPEAAAAFTKSTRYFTRSAVGIDGTSTYSPDSGGRAIKYQGWSSAGARLVEYCLPRKVLYITGKGGSVVTPVVGKELESLMAGSGVNVATASTETLLKLLSSYAVATRENAALELGRREGVNVVDELVAMLKSPNRFTRYGACQGLAQAGKGSKKAFDALYEIIKNEKDDFTMLYFAVTALSPESQAKKSINKLGPPPMRFSELLLKKVGQYFPEDPQRKLQEPLAQILFDRKGGMHKGGSGLETVDRQLLEHALKAILENPKGAVRANAARIIGTFSKEELESYWASLYYSAVRPSPSGVMFAGQLYYVVNPMFSKYHIKEGIPIGWHHFTKDGWGSGKRRGTLECMAPYGKHLLPLIENSARAQYTIKTHEGAANAYKMIKASGTPPLRSIKKEVDAYKPIYPPLVPKEWMEEESAKELVAQVKRAKEADRKAEEAKLAEKAAKITGSPAKKKGKKKKKKKGKKK